MSDLDYHYFRDDPAARWQQIAQHIQAQPADLSIALENLNRWERLGRVHPAPLQEWRKRILAARDTPDAMCEFIEFLATPNHDSEPIKSCSPFVGLSFACSAHPHQA